MASGEWCANRHRGGPCTHFGQRTYHLTHVCRPTFTDPSTYLMPVASVVNLTVRYGSKTAISDLTVDVPEGCVGLLGPNGAGKTTLIKTLLGFVKPSGGSAEILGWDVARQGFRVRRRIGLMPEVECHIPGMNAVTFVAYCGELCGMPASQAMRRAHEVLEYCGLGEARYRDVEGYSQGMKQRIKLAQALVHGPALVFLDEPTNGLDPEGREQMLNLIRDISHGKGVNVVVSSHLLPDIERTCDRLIVMKGGVVVMQGEIAALKATGGTHVDVELKEVLPGFLQALRSRGVEVEPAVGTRCRAAFPSAEMPVGRVLFEAARESGAQVRGFKSSQRSLEDVFIEALA